MEEARAVWSAEASMTVAPMIKRDCRHFPGDRPCEFHKRNLVACENCSDYSPRGTAILMIKLDALGDVLRTTSVLPALRRQYGPCHITWLTSEAALDLFTGNGLVDRVISTSDDYLAALLSRTFDVVINPDASPRSCEIATLPRARAGFGYRLGPEGAAIALNRAADRWLEMGGSDLLKRANTRSYQSILHEICDVDPAGQHIVLGLTPAEAAARNVLAGEIGIDPRRPVVGLNTGAGARWRHKKWRAEGFVELIEMILDGSRAQVVLLGGELENERNTLIKSAFGHRVRNPASKGIRSLVRMVDLCDTVVTGDTLALHVALGLGKRVVALFGPTSAAEIDMYGLGAKIVSPVDCVCCYLSDCDRQPGCMDLIDAATVYRHLEEQMKIAAAGGGMQNRAGESDERAREDACLVGEPA